MGCLLAIVALLLPRLALVLIFLFARGWFQAAYQTAIVPLLGFLFMPYTTLAWMFVVLNWGQPLTPLGWIVIVLAVLADIGHWGGGHRARRKR